MAGKYNLPDGYKGDTYEGQQFTVSINGLAEDLTNYSIRCMFRSENKKGTVVRDISIGSGITLVDAVNGVFLMDQYNIDFDADMYFYDIEMTAPNGDVNTYVCGKIKVIQDTTYE